MTTAVSRAHARPPGLERPPRVGVMNLMPCAEEFEGMLLPQFGAAKPFEPVWIKTPGRRYANDDWARIDNRYVLLRDAGELDALVVTGAAVEHLPFDQVRFMGEVANTVRHAVLRGIPVLGLCWGALAVGYVVLGLSHQVLPQKVSGVYETDLLVAPHAIGKGLDDRFWTAHSRFAGFDESTVDAAVAAGRVRVLGRAPSPVGTVIAESCDHRVLMHIGHPEYGASRLVHEYRRDIAMGLADVQPPANVDLDRPVCRWRSHSRMFFANWIELVYSTALAKTSHPAAQKGRWEQ
ncbi:homoserine O-acetyltransferase/O-succinyltransferase family protein [Streptomyces ochraceiscleroticus]|uniref:Homoserine O-succinyltransferase n=1 Tax=Streptomyces ochraceiscleroticus TaxID=47761 RepID=A0ABW1MM68_9ACTN|nr:homoserine O-succinyltransferase [Streptomyces ochraceiscleroticus]